MPRTTALFAAIALALGIATPACAATTRPRHQGCTKTVADYQYAHAALHPENEVLTATTLSCRTGAPWVMLFHGGSWIRGDRTYTADAATKFYGYGWQSFNVEYRMGDDVTWAMQKNDLRAAYDWIVAHASTFGLDPAKGTVYGFSAGGHLAAWLGNLRPLSSVVSVSGVLQPQRLADDDNGLRPDTEPTTSGMHGAHLREITMMGCDFPGSSDCRATWDDFDPETALTASSAAVYALQGDDDPNLPGPMPDAYAWHVRTAGVDATVVHVPGYGHTPAILFDGTPASNSRFYAVRAWIAAHW